MKIKAPTFFPSFLACVCWACCARRHACPCVRVCGPTNVSHESLNHPRQSINRSIDQSAIQTIYPYKRKAQTHPDLPQLDPRVRGHGPGLLQLLLGRPRTAPDPPQRPQGCSGVDTGDGRPAPPPAQGIGGGVDRWGAWDWKNALGGRQPAPRRLGGRPPQHRVLAPSAGRCGMWVCGSMH